MWHLSEKIAYSYWISCFAMYWRGKIEHILIAYFIINISAKNYQNWFTFVALIAKQCGEIFGNTV